MTDVLWPPDIAPAQQEWSILGNVAAFQSPTNGATRTYGRPGARWACRVTVPPVKGTDRARLMAVLGALRDRSSRIWMPDFSVTQRGSFPATELLTNNDFSNGTTGWSTTSVTTHTAQDRQSRGTINSGALYPQIYQSSVVVSQYVPYALRAFVKAAGDLSSVNVGPAISDGSYQTDSYTLDRGLRVIKRTALAASQSVFPWVVTSPVKAGNFVDCTFTSYARCILVDNGPNAFIESNAIENSTYWGRSGLSNVTSGGTAPDGAATSRSIVENSSGGSHYVGQTVTVSSAVAEYSFSIYVKAATRSYGYIQLVEVTGGSAAYSYFDLNDGTWDTESIGANWSNLRKHITSCGNGWYRLTITAQKTNAATQITGLVGMASAANTGTYTGDGASYMEVWHGSIAASSQPVVDRLTTSSATTGTAQTGTTLYVKGLPASTSGILLAGDPFQIGGQRNIATASLDSDAAGLGVLQCAVPVRSVADNEPIIINTPMCKMMLAGDSLGWDTGPGQFSQFSIDLIEDIT